MPEQLEALKISERRNINPRHTAVAILLATVIGSVGDLSGFCWISTIDTARNLATLIPPYWDLGVMSMCSLKIG